MNQGKIASIFLLGATIGGVGAYWVAYSHTAQKYERILQDEIDQVKSHYRTVHTKDKYDTPEDMLAEKMEEESAKDEYVARVAQYEIEQERVVGGPSAEKKGAESRNIFDYSKLGKEGVAVVDDDAIRVISYEEFDGENEEYTKTSLTYYKADDTVADEMDDIVQDVEATLGPDGLTSFGVLDPTNPDVAYIRNDRLSVDYEVIVEERGFREVVVGE